MNPGGRGEPRPWFSPRTASLQSQYEQGIAAELLVRGTVLVQVCDTEEVQGSWFDTCDGGVNQTARRLRGWVRNVATSNIAADNVISRDIPEQMSRHTNVRPKLHGHLGRPSKNRLHRTFKDGSHVEF
jgi:hypothetical protein